MSPALLTRTSIAIILLILVLWSVNLLLLLLLTLLILCGILISLTCTFIVSVIWSVLLV